MKNLRFALVTMDEGDQEILAQRDNAELLTLAECSERAKTRPRKSLQELREKYAKPA